MKILYVYSGSRKDKFQGISGKDFPDTQFYGYDHLKDEAGKIGLSVEVDYLERDEALPPVMRRIPFFRGGIGFRMRHLYAFFATRKYDIVFGSSLLYMMLLKKLLGSRAKYILLSIGLIRTIRAHEHHPIRSWIIRWLMRELDSIVCLSRTHTEWLESRFDFLKGKTRFVPLGVDTAYYKPVFEGRSGYVLSVGRDNGRDYKTLIEAARKLPDVQFEIVCSRRNLEGIASLPGNVRVSYDLPFAELTKRYRAAGMMVLSTHDDGFEDGSDCSGQTVLLDSMANGLPVIVSRKRYLDDYIRGGEDALIVDCYDPDSIIAAIRQLQNEAVRLRLAMHARERVERQFSTKNMAASLAAVFKAL